MNRCCSRPGGSACQPPESGDAGFSLLELLLVMAILVLLVTLYWSPGGGSRQRALQSACQNNLQKLQISMQIFSGDNEGRFPVVSGAHASSEALEPLVPRYTSDKAVFICPASKDQAPPGNTRLGQARISYAYYMGRSISNSQQVIMTDAQINTEPKASGELLFSADGKAPGNNHGKSGGNLLFGDGHVQLSGPRAPIPLPVGPKETLLNP